MEGRTEKGREEWSSFLIWWYEAREQQFCFPSSKRVVIAVKISLLMEYISIKAGTQFVTRNTLSGRIGMKFVFNI